MSYNPRHHICECASKRCRTKFEMTYPQYLALTENGQRIVAKGHVNHSVEKVVGVVCDGSAFVVEKLSRKPKVVRAAPRPKKLRSIGRSEYEQFWLDRFTMDEIYEMASDMGDAA